jgi:hypothetical protein
VLRIALRLFLVLVVAATVLYHVSPKKPAIPVAIDPYRKAESVLRARGFAPDATAPTLGLATQVVSYSSDECPRGVAVAVLSYDQLRIVLERRSAGSPRPYLVVAPFWEKSDLDRFDLFLAGVACRVRDPFASAIDECEKYLYITYTPGCLREEDWRDFWRVR